MSEVYSFQAETQQLLEILVHSLYTEREIFLRELISNASDALSRFQFEQLTNDSVRDPELPLEIRITFDADAGTLTVSDTGIGLTRDEMIENLGTIARSGARNFIQALRDAANTETAQNIIGQFGVGFYSVFMIADKVRVVSQSYRPDAEAVAWEATGGTTYTLEPAEREHRGTDIIIYVKEDAKELLTDWKLRNIVKQHSDYVAFPIYVGDNEAPANQQTAIWRRPARELSDEDYNGFYRMLTMDFEEPLYHVHVRADVPMQYYALLYVPSNGEQNMFSLRREPGLKLYARKVLIEEYNRDLLPEYLQFVQGVVDSEDLPLSVSRESVRADRIMANLRASLTKKMISEFKRLAKNEQETYLKIYSQFGRFLKQGLVSAPQDREDLVDLLYFNSSHDNDPDSFHSLFDYVERMVEGQTEIYYVIADDFAGARRSPHLDAFRQRGIEVLYFSDPVDAVLPLGLTEYRGHAVRAVDEADIDLKDVGQTPDEETQSEPVEEDSWSAVLKRVRAVLGGRISDVRASATLSSSPARLVSSEGDVNRHMYRINRLLDRDYEIPVKLLELNPRHPLLHNLGHLVQKEANYGLVDAVIEQIFETALLQEGIHPDPAAMSDRLTRLMQAATGSPSDQLGFTPAQPNPQSETGSESVEE